MTSKKKQELWTCDICATEGITATFKAPTALGMHKRLKHGIEGQSKASQKYREAKAAKNPSVEIATKPLTKKEKEHITKNGKKRSGEKRTYITNADIQAAIIVGYITYICEAEAEKLSVSKEQFTKRCAELFFASKLRY